MLTIRASCDEVVVSVKTMLGQAARARHVGALPGFLFTSIVCYAHREKQTEAWR